MVAASALVGKKHQRTEQETGSYRTSWGAEFYRVGIGRISNPEPRDWWVFELGDWWVLVDFQT